MEKRQALLSCGKHHCALCSFSGWHTLCKEEAGIALFVTYVTLLHAGRILVNYALHFPFSDDYDFSYNSAFSSTEENF